MKLYGIFIYGLLLSLNPGFAQMSPAEADELFETGRFGAALPYYLDLLKKDPENAAVNYKIGVCYLNSRSQKPKAVSYLEKAVQNSASFYTHGNARENDAPITAYSALGDAYEICQRFDQAIDSYQKYKDALVSSKNTDISLTTAADRKIERCSYGKELRETAMLPENLSLEKYKTPVKPKNPDLSTGEYSVALSADKSFMIYTIRIPVDNLKKKLDSRFFEDSGIKPRTDTLVKKQTAVKSAKTAKEHDTIINIATVGTSVDGQVVLTYKDEQGDACLYVSRLNGNKWTTPQKLPKTVNTKGWEPNEFLSSDGNYLYFASDREGGYGGKDIYRCKKTSGGEWGKAVNMGPLINTAYDDEAPFPHPDGSTLYFSSNRANPSGSFDIYTSVLLDSLKWNKPMIVGYPVNSSESDVFYQVAADKKKIFTSKANVPLPKNDAGEEKHKSTKKNKKDSILESEKAERDNYLITFRSPTRSPLTLLKGVVYEEKTNKGLPAKITVVDNETGKLQSIYHTNPKTGGYLFMVPAGKNNNITFENDSYLFHSENLAINHTLDYFEKQNDVSIAPVAEGSKTILKNVFFEKDGSVLLPVSSVELNKVYEFLRGLPEVSVKLNNYIYTRENTKQNKKLSEERAKAVMTYLLDKGIDRERIEIKGYRKSDLPEKENKETAKNKEKTVQVLELEINDIKKTKIK
jgi:outer membrane protein OmpA-like peptidoglycan-associated protein/tetratricopeptide (TPR) repeat protein